MEQKLVRASFLTTRGSLGAVAMRLIICFGDGEQKPGVLM